MNFTLITAFSLCSLCWFSVSGSEFQTMDVQSGQDVTLTCSNVSQSDTLIIWFRVVGRTSDGFICTMSPSGGVTKESDKLSNGKYKTSSNSSSVFLTIKLLDSSDSGLYVCGILRAGKLLLNRTHLNIDGGDKRDGKTDNKYKQSDEIPKLMSVALGGLSGVLVIVVVGLVGHFLKLKKAQKQNPEQTQNRSFDDPNYAVSRKRAKRIEMDPNAVYANR